MPTACTVTGTFQDATSASLQGNAFVRFRLRNFAGFVPRVLGTAILVETQIDVFPASNGTFSTQLWGNDNIDPGAASNPPSTFYTIEFWNGGRITSQANFSIVGSSFDLGTSAQTSAPSAPKNSAAPSILLETNGVKNGSQTKFNAVAGSGITITDDGAGDVTFAAATGGSSLTGAGSSVFAIPTSTVTFNISTEGTIDWILQLGSASSETTFESPLGWTWKKLGASRGQFMSLALSPNDTNQGASINTLTVSPARINVTASDGAKFANLPAINASFCAPGNSSTATLSGHRIIYPGDGSLRHFKIYVWTSRPLVDVQLVAHLLSGAVPDVSITRTNTNAADGAILLFQFQAQVLVGDSIAFDAQVLNLNGATFAGAGIQAISVF